MFHEGAKLIGDAFTEGVNSQLFGFLECHGIFDEGCCSLYLRVLFNCLDRSMPVGAGSPQVSRSHHEGIAFGARDKIGPEEGRVQPGKAVVVPVDSRDSINDEHDVRSKPSPCLSDFFDVITAQSDIRQYEYVRKDLFIS